MVIYIKNMSHKCCIRTLTDILKEMGFKPLFVYIGFAVIEVIPDFKQLEALDRMLKQWDLQRLCNGECSEVQLAILEVKELISKIEQQKIVIKHDKNNPFTLKRYLKEAKDLDYDVLNLCFKTELHMSLDRYYLIQRIERAVYWWNLKLTLAEIAEKVGFDDRDTLSKYFKKIKGFTPKNYKPPDVMYFECTKACERYLFCQNRPSHCEIYYS
jgi:AraC family transcriptional regulator